MDIATLILLLAAVLFVAAIYFGWGRGRGVDHLRQRVMEIAKPRLDPAMMPRGDAPAQAERALETLVKQLESEASRLSESQARCQQRLGASQRLAKARGSAASRKAALDEATSMVKADAGYVAFRDVGEDEFLVAVVSGLPLELAGKPIAGLGEQATKEPSVMAQIFGNEAAALPWEKDFGALLAISFDVSGTRRGVIGLYKRQEPFSQQNLEDVSWIGRTLGETAEVPPAAPVESRAETLTDEVTELYNERFFWSQTEKELNRARRFSHAISLLLLSVDNFELYVDAYGQTVADRILKLIAEALRDSLREVDIIARHRGNEFAIILPETDLAGARVVGEKIRQDMQTKGLVVDSGKKFWLTVSVGTATSPLGEATSRGIFHVADQALNQASQNRNAVVNYVLSLTSRRAEGS